jgi:hypothetical protein
MDGKLKISVLVAENRIFQAKKDLDRYWNTNVVFSYSLLQNTPSPSDHATNNQYTVYTCTKVVGDASYLGRGDEPEWIESWGCWVVVDFWLVIVNRVVVACWVICRKKMQMTMTVLCPLSAFHGWVDSVHACLLCDSLLFQILKKWFVVTASPINSKILYTTTCSCFHAIYPWFENCTGRGGVLISANFFSSQWH